MNVLTEPDPVVLPLSPEVVGHARSALGRTMGAWILWSVLVLVAHRQWAPPGTVPNGVIGLSVGLGLWAAHPACRSGCLAAAGLAIPLALLEPSLWASPYWIASGLGGAFAGWIRGAPRQERLQAVLAGLAGVGTAGLLVQGLDLEGHGLLAGTLLSIGSACVLVPLHITWRPLPPGPRQIRRTLAPPWQGPALLGTRLYQRLTLEQPPHDTTKGLSEVASWVYLLSLSMQRLERELDGLPEETVRQSLCLLLKEMETTKEGALKDRRMATVKHYQRVLGHLEQLRSERERLCSLQAYALAYLEEARLGLLIARTRPGDVVPGHLEEVLARLRANAAEADAVRRTSREVLAYG